MGPGRRERRSRTVAAEESLRCTALMRIVGSTAKLAGFMHTFELGNMPQPRPTTHRRERGNGELGRERDRLARGSEPARRRTSGRRAPLRFPGTVSWPGGDHVCVVPVPMAVDGPSTPFARAAEGPVRGTEGAALGSPVRALYRGFTLYL